MSANEKMGRRVVFKLVPEEWREHSLVTKKGCDLIARKAGQAI